MTSPSDPEPVRPGVRVIRGSTFSIPTGALTISMAEDGTTSMNISRVESSVQMWPSWITIAFDRLVDARKERQRMADARSANDDEAESDALMGEFHAALQAISAAVFALDAFYSVIKDMVMISAKEAEARRNNGAGRAVWVADAICRAASIPNAARKAVNKNVHIAYSLRDDAVHSPFQSEEFVAHPGLNQAVPKFLASYTLEASFGIVTAAIEAIMWPVDRPNRRNPDMIAYAEDASTLLHEIVDEHLTYSPDGPFTSKAATAPGGTES